MTKRVSNKRREPHPVDIHVGATIRSLRLVRGLSQEDLGGEVGVSYQQIQKYETGSNRVAASKLYQIAGVLEAEINAFFERRAVPDE